MLIGNSELPEKKTYGYRERDDQKGAEFLKKLEALEESRIIYVNEAGFDEREDYPYGYSPKGERCYALKSGQRTERVSWSGKCGLGVSPSRAIFQDIAALREKNYFLR